jgi:hypothetical protein
VSAPGTTLDLESRLALAEDAPAIESFLGPVAGRLHPQSPGAAGVIEDDGGRWLELHPAAHPEQTYVVRLTWKAYPHAAPSVTFVLEVGGSPGDMAAWPLIPGYRAPNDICMPFTAEGYAVHPEWTTGPQAWDSTGNPFLRVVTQIQDDLDNRYQGRAA